MITLLILLRFTGEGRPGLTNGSAEFGHAKFQNVIMCRNSAHVLHAAEALELHKRVVWDALPPAESRSRTFNPQYLSKRVLREIKCEVTLAQKMRLR